MKRWIGGSVDQVVCAMVFCLPGQLFFIVMLIEFALWEVRPFSPFTRCVICSLGEMTAELTDPAGILQNCFKFHVVGGWEFFSD